MRKESSKAGPWHWLSLLGLFPWTTQVEAAVTPGSVPVRAHPASSAEEPAAQRAGAGRANARPGREKGEGNWLQPAEKLLLRLLQLSHCSGTGTQRKKWPYAPLIPTKLSPSLRVPPVPAGYLPVASPFSYTQMQQLHREIQTREEKHIFCVLFKEEELFLCLGDFGLFVLRTGNPI